MIWKPGDPDRRRTQTRCQGEIFNQIDDLKKVQVNIEKQLNVIVSHMESDKKNLEYHMNRVNGLIEHHGLTLFGDGTKQKPGNCERINRLETIEDNRRHHFLVLWGAVIASAVKTGWDFFSGK